MGVGDGGGGVDGAARAQPGGAVAVNIRRPLVAVCPTVAQRPERVVVRAGIAAGKRQPQRRRVGSDLQVGAVVEKFAGQHIDRLAAFRSFGSPIVGGQGVATECGIGHFRFRAFAASQPAVDDHAHVGVVCRLLALDVADAAPTAHSLLAILGQHQLVAVGDQRVEPGQAAGSVVDQLAADAGPVAARGEKGFHPLGVAELQHPDRGDGVEAGNLLHLQQHAVLERAVHHRLDAAAEPDIADAVGGSQTAVRQRDVDEEAFLLPHDADAMLGQRARVVEAIHQVVEERHLVHPDLPHQVEQFAAHRFGATVQPLKDRLRQQPVAAAQQFLRRAVPVVHDGVGASAAGQVEIALLVGDRERVVDGNVDGEDGAGRRGGVGNHRRAIHAQH